MKIMPVLLAFAFVALAPATSCTFFKPKHEGEKEGKK
jgi:hypothetical protein